MVKFDEIISSSLEWTTTVLFRPFSPKKWLILTFIAFLAGSLAGGNSNFNFRSSDNRTKEASAAQQPQTHSFQIAKIETPKEKIISEQELKGFFKKSVSSPVIFIIILAILIGIVIFLILLWVCSRFYFIFLEDIIKNDASIAVSFKSNKALGNSYFRFNLLFTFIFLSVTAAVVLKGYFSLAKIGVFSNPDSLDIWRILITLFPYIMWAILIILLAALIGLVVNDFVILIMYKDKIKIVQAIKKVFSILLLNKLNFTLYVLIKIGLTIVSQIIYSIISLVTIAGLIFPGAIIASILYFIFRIMPGNMQSVFMITVVVAAIPIILFLWYCLMCMYLPFAVFFRTFSVKFFGRLDSRYNLFIYTDDHR